MDGGGEGNVVLRLFVVSQVTEANYDLFVGEYCVRLLLDLHSDYCPSPFLLELYCAASAFAVNLTAPAQHCTVKYFANTHHVSCFLTHRFHAHTSSTEWVKINDKSTISGDETESFICAAVYHLHRNNVAPLQILPPGRQII